MEIERKYLISSVPFDLSSYPCRKIEQGYLSTDLWYVSAGTTMTTF